MVGASLALALKDTPLSVVLIEKTEEKASHHPSFDARVLALSNATRRVFETLGVWQNWGSQLSSVKKIHVSEQGGFGSTVIDANELGLEQLGFVLPAIQLGRGLTEALKSTPTQPLHGSTVCGMRVGEDRVTLDVQSPTGQEVVQARLVIAADGADSLIRQACQIGVLKHDYAQSAIIAHIKSTHPQPSTAYERFTAEGPIAVLPRPDGAVVIWVVPPTRADQLLALNASEFLSQLQSAFGWRLGRWESLGQRHRYELQLTVAERVVADRVVLMGNAAQSLHPIAGQGFNLGLRDAMMLAELVANAKREDPNADVGRADLLQHYQQQRQNDRTRVVQFTDSLVRVFGLTLPGARLLRSRALKLFDVSPFLKRQLAAIGSGGAEAPRLARGLSLLAEDKL